MQVAATRDDEVAQLFATPQVASTHRPDGSILVKSTVPLADSDASVGVWIERWAAERPERVFLGQRFDTGSNWITLTYAELRRRVRSVAAWMISRRLSAERPLVILSDNSIEHAVFALAAMYAGVPVGTVSSAYSLMSKDHAKLRAAIELLDPGAIYVDDAAPFKTALEAIEPHHRATVVARWNAETVGATESAYVLGTPDTPVVTRAFDAVTPATIAKFLFTSGSTGLPKAVINTHGMLTASQTARRQAWPFLADLHHLVVLDWLPWSHTFGANHNFNMVLRNGGTLFIDHGKPAPGLFNASLDNLRSVVPTVYFNVPRGFDMLLGALREDEALRQKFFSGVRFAFYAAAALPQNLWDAMRELSIKTTGRAIPLVSAWGSTETAPLATDCHFLADRPGNIGVPVAGTELKLVPNGEKLEVRVRGPNVTPGYWKAPELTADAFDDEGFYRIGDAVKFADPERPELGLFFDGRISEDFKLSSGTWVTVGMLRVAAVAALAPLAQDIVIAGHGEDEVRFLVFPNVAACRAVSGLADTAPLASVLAHAKVREAVAQGLARLKAQNSGSAGHATRALLLSEPPSIDGGEITDKGYINQRAVLSRRSDALARLRDDKSSEWIGCA